jgi:hypothetical protein
VRKRALPQLQVSSAVPLYKTLPKYLDLKSEQVCDDDRLNGNVLPAETIAVDRAGSAHSIVCSPMGGSRPRWLIDGYDYVLSTTRGGKYYFRCRHAMERACHARAELTSAAAEERLIDFFGVHVCCK